MNFRKSAIHHVRRTAALLSLLSPIRMSPKFFEAESAAIQIRQVRLDEVKPLRSIFARFSPAHLDSISLVRLKRRRIDRSSARCGSNENTVEMGFVIQRILIESCSSHFLEFRFLPSSPFLTFTFTFTLHHLKFILFNLTTQSTCSAQFSLLFALRSPLVVLSPRPRSPASPPLIQSSKPLRRQTR